LSFCQSKLGGGDDDAGGVRGGRDRDHRGGGVFRKCAKLQSPRPDVNTEVLQIVAELGFRYGPAHGKLIGLADGGE
jgi:hypothetical protein